MLLFFQVLFPNILFHAHKFRFLETSREFSDLLGCEFDGSGFHCEKRIIAAALHILTRAEFCPALTNDDIPSLHFLSAVFFYTKTFGLRISAKLCGAACFSVCHKIKLKVSEFTSEFTIE